MLGRLAELLATLSHFRPRKDGFDVPKWWAMGAAILLFNLWAWWPSKKGTKT